jgi:hypothetical protein
MKVLRGKQERIAAAYGRRHRPKSQVDARMLAARLEPGSANCRAPTEAPEHASLVLAAP